MVKKTNTINVKFNEETKQDIDALAFMLDCSKQQLCENLIIQGIEPYKGSIAKIRKVKEQ